MIVDNIMMRDALEERRRENRERKLYCPGDRNGDRLDWLFVVGSAVWALAWIGLAVMLILGIELIASLSEVAE